MTIRSLLHRTDESTSRFLDVHGKARDALRRLGPDVFYSFYRFAFVRNPWDRLLSWYMMYLRPNSEGNKLRENIFRTGDTFDNFIRRGDTEQQFGRWFRSTGYNQLDYITDNSGNLLVNDVYRFEKFEEHCHLLAETIGTTFPRIPHRNATEHEHYSTYYTPELVEIVRRRFARDIEFFGYRFESH